MQPDFRGRNFSKPDIEAHEQLVWHKLAITTQSLQIRRNCCAMLKDEILPSPAQNNRRSAETAKPA